MHWNEVKDFKSIIEAFIIHALLTNDDGEYCHTFKEISNIAIVKKNSHSLSYITKNEIVNYTQTLYIPIYTINEPIKRIDEFVDSCIKHFA